MLVISWQGGMTGVVTLGRQTEFTVGEELAVEGKGKGYG